MKDRASVCLLVVALIVSPLVVRAEHWPQFRGPGNLGVVESPGLPESWGPNKNIQWKTTIPGHGWSSPVVWSDRIFVTAVVPSGEVEAPKKGLYLGGERPAPAVEHRWMVYAVDWATGKIVWEREANRGVPEVAHHLKNTYASETPVTDGERVYVSFGNVGVFAYDFSGTLAWSQRFGPFPTRNGWGTGASPALHNGRLYLVYDNDQQSFITALDALTGKAVWRTDRNEGTNWATPFVWQHTGRTEIVTSGSGNIRSYDLEGRLLWQLGPMSTIVIPTPFSQHGLLYVTSGYVGDSVRPVYAVKPGASGDISLKKGEASNASVAWTLPQGGPYNPSPIVYGDYYYTLFDRGFLTCHDARTGKEIYSKVRIDAAASGFSSSPWAYNGRLFAMSEDGNTYVIQAGPDYKLLGQNSLDEFTLATPAIDRDSLIVRTATTLYRIRK